MKWVSGWLGYCMRSKFLPGTGTEIKGAIMIISAPALPCLFSHTFFQWNLYKMGEIFLVLGEINKPHF